LPVAPEVDASPTSPRDDVFDLQAATYDAWYDSPRGRAIVAEERAALAPLLGDLPRPWLEVGTGTGRFAHHRPARANGRLLRRDRTLNVGSDHPLVPFSHGSILLLEATSAAHKSWSFRTAAGGGVCMSGAKRRCDRCHECALSLSPPSLAGVDPHVADGQRPVSARRAAEGCLEVGRRLPGAETPT
jgi:hypothetical protein